MTTRQRQLKRLEYILRYHLGSEDLLDAIIQAMTEAERADVLEYIAQVNNIKEAA